VFDHKLMQIGVQWGLGHPQKMIDFGYRSVHGSTLLAKSIVEQWYGCNISYSYFSGCSTGGRQGLKEIEQ
jgi:feruloyl esterase